MPPDSNRLSAANYALIGSLSFFWAINWPIMKVALAEIPPWTIRAVTLSIGGLLLLIVARLGGKRLGFARSDLVPVLLVALFNVIGWHLCMAHGLSRMEAGRASVLGFTMPLWAVIAGRFILKERITRAKALGLGLGLAGLALLIGPDLAALKTSTDGALLMLAAAVSWGIGTVLIKRFEWGMPIMVVTGWQLVLGSLPIILGALWFDSGLEPARLSWGAWAAVAYVTLLPIFFCHWAYYTIVSRLPVATAAISTLTIPVIGVISSAVLLGEMVGWRDILAMLLILSALTAVLFNQNR